MSKRREGGGGGKGGVTQARGRSTTVQGDEENHTPPQPSHKKKTGSTPPSSTAATQQVLSKYFNTLPASASSLSSTAAPPSSNPSPLPASASTTKRSSRSSASTAAAKASGSRAKEVVSLSDDEVEVQVEDEVDAMMGVTGDSDTATAAAPHSADVFQSFAFKAPEGTERKGGDGSVSGRAPRAPRVKSEEKEEKRAVPETSARKRRRIQHIEDEEDEAKENSPSHTEEAMVEEEENNESKAAEMLPSVMDDEDEDAPLSFRLPLPTQPAAVLRANATKDLPQFIFPSHFTSDPSIHRRNVNRFLERETLNDGTEADADPTAVTHSTSSSSLDLTDDTLPLPSPPPRPTKTVIKYTPLEKQVLDIQRKHPDLLLFFEVGYKFRLFGKDAEVAAKHLDIIAHPSHNFLTASIPTFRLNVHVKRLVEAGYKVGVVRQTESAAQKKIAKDSGGFARKLTELYTKATQINEVLLEEKASEGENASRFIAVLYEEPGVGNWTPPSASSPFFDSGPVVVHLVAFDPITGVVVYDSFDEGFMRNELETRLLQLSPVEVLMPESGRWLSKNTWKLIQGWKEGREVVRVERMDQKRFPFDFAKGTSVITDYYTTASSSSASSSLDFVLSLPKGVVVCLSVLIPYLQAFHLTSAFLLSANFRPFLNIRYMHLNNSTLLNLEILSSTSSDQRRGSLLWLLQHTKTPFGSRLLRHWVSHPLLSLDSINERLDAVTELMNSANEWVSPTATLLASLPDLERGLSRIHYSTCKPTEFLLLLQAYQRILTTLPAAAEVTSTRIRGLLESIDREGINEVLSFFLGKLNAEALDAEDKSNFYTDPDFFPALIERKAAIAECQQTMHSLLLSIRQLLGPSYHNLEYKSVLTSHYLIEVDNRPGDLSRVPQSWIKVNSTKAKVRYHTPDIVNGWMRLQRAEELLVEESDKSWRALLAQFSESYALFRHIINVLSEVDCLLSLATTSLTVKYTRPQFVPGERVLEMEDFRHPMTEQMITSPYVPNTVRLGEGGEELMLITGPNMGGKSSLIRGVSLCIILAQLGCYVPATSCTLSVFDAIYTRMGARDSLYTGKSTFLVELAETRAMLTSATPRSLLVFDELGRGTSTNDGVAIAYAVMEWVVKQLKALTMLVTHYPQLARLTDEFPGRVGVYHMNFLSERRRGVEREEEKGEVEDEDVDVTFMYSLVKGVAPRSFGLNVARLAHVDEEVMQRAAFIAAKMRGHAMTEDGGGEEKVQEEGDDIQPAVRESLDALLAELDADDSG